MSSDRQSRRRGRARVVLASCLGVIILLIWALSQAGSALIVRAPLLQPDAIISLASHEWERLPLTARLAAAYPDALILLTVPPVVSPFNCHDCANRVERLGLLGVGASRVRLLPIIGPGTHGEAVAALQFARENGIRSLLVATSPYHTRRSLAVFRKVFEDRNFRVGVEPAIPESKARPTRWWATADDRAYVPYEWAALIYYAMKYRVGFFAQSLVLG